MIERPKSVSSIAINITGLLSFFVVLALMTYFKPAWPIASKVVVVLLAIAIPIIVLEFFYRRPPLLVKAFKSKQLFSPNWKRVFVKLLALYTIFLVIALIYWVYPEYRGDFYNPFRNILYPAMPWVILLAIPYFFIVDEMMEQPDDAYYSFGLWLLRRKEFDKSGISQLFLAWLVKLFFLPLMIVYFTGNISSIVNSQNVSHFFSFEGGFNFLWLLFFTIDLAFTCVGYVLTLRLLDSHIRTTEPTGLGWAAAIICYQPFYGGISAMYFAYNLDNFEWGRWLADSPVLYTIWGLMILVCLLIYAFATVMFGIRFSNLTNRGIITNGPFRYFKHPAYMSKNLSWWLVAVPFVSQSDDIPVIIRSCLMLLSLNAIYFIRAKTEERHLMSDPTYRQYCEWIKVHGTYAKMKRALGFKDKGVSAA